MKVLMVDQFLPNSVYVVELCRELRKYAKITIFCKKNAGTDLDGVIWKDKLYAGGKGKMAAVWEYGKGLFRLQKEIKKGSYDVVHVQSFKDAKYEIPLYCKNKKYIPRLVHTVHNLLPHEASAGDRELYSRFYNCCDLLVVHNEYCRQLLMKEYQIPEEKICITPHGSYTQIRKEENTDFGLTDRKIRFLQFGILRPYKGVDILLKALAQIPAEKREKIQVTIAGAQHPKLDPTDYGAMIRDLGLEDTVDLIKKHIPDEELDALYRQADICLFPYRDIYGSGALLMAYSYGKPVITSDIPAFREETQNGKTGILTDGEDPEKLKEAILKAADWSRKEYLDDQKEIEKLTEEKYSWKISAKILWEAYRKR